MMEMSEQTDFQNNTLVEKMEENETIDDTEEGEILEDGEIADEEELSSDKHKDEHKENTNRDKDSVNKERDYRRKDKVDDKTRDKDKDRARDNRESRERENREKDRERERERERRHTYERNERERERKTGDDRERERKASNEEDRDKRRRERDRKRRRSDEEDRDERSRDDKRKRSREQGWSDYDSNTSRNNFEEYERRFEDLDFRVNDPSFTNIPPVQHSSDDEDFNLDERDFEEMLQIMEQRIPSNRNPTTDGMPTNDKRAMMRAMAIMMRRNIDSDKGRRLAKLRDKRRPNERIPGPTGTRASTRPDLRPERTSGFKQICKFFVEGKCHKGSECSYSHETSPTKKKEICKFYLQGYCGKGDECLFMHSEFPCKFFHTNVECYSGDNCRFSHSPLTDETREILRNYLDSGQLPDDPKPNDKSDKQTKTEANIKTETNNENDSNNNNSLNADNTQTNTTSNTSTPNISVHSTTYTPMKPVAKRHAILGDPTQEMKTSYYTWLWQQEMKELEVAYVGNKRNLFCIEAKFAIAEKPSTPRMEDDEEEIEAQIRSYYMETMGNFEEEDIEPIKEQKTAVLSEEQKLIEASAHDEDLRMLVLRPKSTTNETINEIKPNISNNISDEHKASEQVFDERSQISEESSVASQMVPQSAEVPASLPKVARDLYLKMQNKLQNENESQKSSDWLSDSDDDDKDVLAAALKNVQQSSKPSSADKSKRGIDISKMLSAIRQSSNTANTNPSPKQSDFWQNILSGINLTGSSPSGNSTPPRNEYRDPRLKRGKESMSPSIDTTPPVKICDPNVKIEYKLLPIKVNEIDYSSYVSIYRIDSRLKNDPRLQKFFSKLPSSEIDNLSRIVPPPLKTAPVTPLSVLKSKKKSEKEKRMKLKVNSPTLPPLPPLTISPSKSIPTPGIIPPTPPPIMSPLELISSRPTFTVGDNKGSNNALNDSISSETNVSKDKLKEEFKSAKSPESATSPERPQHSIKSEDIESDINSSQTQSLESLQSLPTLTSNVNPLVKSVANHLLSIPTDIKPVLSSIASPPLTSTLSNAELFESSFDIKSEKDDQKVEPQMDTDSNYSTEDDLYDNLYPSVSTTDYSKTSAQNPTDSLQPIEDELEMIRNELQAPPAIDSDNEMEIDIRERKDSISEVESADECELMIASSSETEDNNNENDLIENTSNNSKDLIQSSGVSADEPMNLTLSDVQNSETNDQSLKSVFSTIDPTASPFC